jgi:hypothetical protein
MLINSSEATGPILEVLNVIFYQNMSNLHNRHKSAEKNNFTEKPGIYVKLLIAM